MKKKKILIVILVIIVIIFGIKVLIYNVRKYNEIQSKRTDYADEIFEKIENKEDLLIYVTDDIDVCNLCPESQEIINYYEKNYDLEFFWFDKSKTTEADYNKLMDYYAFNDDFVVTPFVILMVDGEFKYLSNNVFVEYKLRDVMIEFGFLDKKYKTIDHVLMYDDDFNELYESDEKKLFVFYSVDSYEIRENLLEINEKYPLEFYSIYGYVGKIYKQIWAATFREDKWKEDIKVPSLMVTQNGDVLDFVNTKDKDKLEDFLKKHGFID